MITQIGLLVPSFESLLFWKQRFESFDVKHGEITRYAGRDALPFEEKEGLRLILINHNGEAIPEHWSAWQHSGIEEEHRILGMGPVEITARHLDRLVSTLTDKFGYVEVNRSDVEAVCSVRCRSGRGGDCYQTKRRAQRKAWEGKCPSCSYTCEQ